MNIDTGVVKARGEEIGVWLEMGKGRGRSSVILSTIKKNRKLK